MSADNIIYVKQLKDGFWWVNDGSASVEVEDAWFLVGDHAYPTQKEAIVAGHELHESIGYVEYGVNLL